MRSEMKKFLKIIVLMTSSTLAFGASAQLKANGGHALSYDYIQVGYDGGKVGLGGTKSSQNTTELTISKSVTETFFFTGNYQSSKFSSSTVSAYNIGAGARVPLADGLDLNASLAYTSFNPSSGELTGYSAAVGFRNAITKDVELAGTYVYTSIDGTGQSATISSVGGEVRYRIAELFSIGVGYKGFHSDGSGNTFGLSGRLEF
jgi:hypothetical protein